jgi:predicted PurR-regulated permease PerM
MVMKRCIGSLLMLKDNHVKNLFQLYSIYAIMLAGGKLDKFVQIIRDWLQKLTAVRKRQLALVCTAIFAVFLTISVLVTVNNPKKETVSGVPERYNITAPIPHENLFLPDEPDYIPGVLLEREQKTVWTKEDVAEHWQDPLKFGEEEWREKIEASINELLERVP